jgi:hypothetical protein
MLPSAVGGPDLHLRLFAVLERSAEPGSGNLGFRLWTMLSSTLRRGYASPRLWAQTRPTLVSGELSRRHACARLFAWSVPKHPFAAIRCVREIKAVIAEARDPSSLSLRAIGFGSGHLFDRGHEWCSQK